MPLIDRISAEEREKILRINWWSHDGRWYLYTGREVGFEAANRLNMLVNKSIGKAEMKRLLETLKIDPNRAAEYFFEIIETVSNLYTKDVFEVEGLTKENENTWIYRIKNSPCYEGTKKAGILNLYQCACYKRAEGWAEACGLTADIYIRKSLVKGDDVCEIVFSLKK
ncbi:MAG: DUF6125 family protein [Candidatus Jordarchaeaceae archaeon]